MTWLLAFMLLNLVTLYFGISLLTWIAINGLFLLASVILLGMSFSWFFATLAVTAVGIFLGNPTLRQHLFSQNIFKLMKRALPQISKTEQEALDCGTVWWEKELFSGRPNWEMLRNMTAPKLNQEEKDFLNGPVEDLCAMINDWEITNEHYNLPEEVWHFIRQNRFFGMIIPKKYGGLEFSALAHSSVVMKIASRSISAAVTVMVPNSLGPAELLLKYGTQEQRDHYLPRLASGEEIPCFALTSPVAGSDAGAIPDSGILCQGEFEGKQITGIRLNWDKRYITLSPVATLLGLAFKLYDPDGLLGEEQELGITVALIPTNTPGVETGQRHYPLNQAFMNGPTRGRDVFIPLDWIIGGPQQAGKGWKMLVECLAEGRGISLPSLSTGAGKMLSRTVGAYARVRKQFKTPIGKFEGVEEALARIAANSYMMDATRTLTTSAIDHGERPSVITAIAKHQLTERMRKLVNDGMDIHGGSGICMGPSNYLGRIYQAVPISITVEGANILTRSMIIFGQGATRAHPFLLDEINALHDEDEERGLSHFDKILFQHMAHVAQNVVRGGWFSLTGGIFCVVPDIDVSHIYRKLTRLSNAFAVVSDFGLLSMGGALKRKEKISGRLADVLANMYLISATLKRYEDDGLQEEDLPMVIWSCEDALYQSYQALDGVLQNFPIKSLGLALKIWLFPFGNPFPAPTDKLGHQVASILLTNNGARDRLTKGVYINSVPNDPTGRIENAFNKVLDAEPLEMRIKQAIRDGLLDCDTLMDCLHEAVDRDVITSAEAATILRAKRAVADAIRVDEFKHDLSATEQKKWLQNLHIKAAGLFS